jgi:hypothetical protein
MKVRVCRHKYSRGYCLIDEKCKPEFSEADDFERLFGCHLEPGEKKLMEWRLPLAEDQAPVDQFCDGCIHLSPTEEEQSKLPHPRPEHWCGLFNRAIKHESLHPRIQRLDSCIRLKAKEANQHG